MPAIFDYPHTVQPDEIDELGHVNNVYYLFWLQSAASAHSSAQGWNSAAFHQLGCGFVVRKHEIEYLRPALVGQQLIIRTWVCEMKRASSMRRYQIVRALDNRLLCQAATDWAFVDLQTGIPRRIPVEVSSSFTLVVENPS